MCPCLTPTAPCLPLPCLSQLKNGHLRRPNLGKLGSAVTVLANHFPIEVAVATWASGVYGGLGAACLPAARPPAHLAAYLKLPTCLPTHPPTHPCAPVCLPACLPQVDGELVVYNHDVVIWRESPDGAGDDAGQAC